jgi:hypothetical protein
MTSQKNVCFGPFSWAIAHDFRHRGQLFWNLHDFYQILVDDIIWGCHWFMGHRVHVPCLLQAVSLPFQPRITINHSEDRMTHFVTLMVPPPHTKHSLRHSTAKVGLRARRFRILWLRKKRLFRAIFVSYSTRFSVPGSTFFETSRIFSKSL